MSRSSSGFTPLRRYAEDGFTLVEMMVALFIFALIAASGVTLLSVGVRAQAAASARLDETAELRRASVLLANDLSQIVPRLTRRRDGTSRRAFTGTDGSGVEPAIGYVRAGWSNPGEATRAGLQRVEIALEGQRLVRRGFAGLDGAESATEITLASGVTNLALRYRDRKGAWRSRWDEPLPDAMPSAVELTVTRGTQPPLTLAFLAGAAYP
jgi:general secretion pathway protein J